MDLKLCINQAGSCKLQFSGSKHLVKMAKILEERKRFRVPSIITGKEITGTHTMLSCYLQIFVEISGSLTHSKIKTSWVLYWFGLKCHISYYLRIITSRSRRPPLAACLIWKMYFINNITVPLFGKILIFHSPNPKPLWWGLYGCLVLTRFHVCHVHVVSQLVIFKQDEVMWHGIHHYPFLWFSLAWMKKTGANKRNRVNPGPDLMHVCS